MSETSRDGADHRPALLVSARAALPPRRGLCQPLGGLLLYVEAGGGCPKTPGSRNPGIS